MPSHNGVSGVTIVATSFKCFQSIWVFAHNGEAWWLPTHFFPFSDGVEEGAKAGATAVIQPGGSVRDNEVIAAADRLNLAMVFTGMRYFLH